MPLMLVRQFGLAGVAAIVLYFAENSTDPGTKTFLRWLAAACVLGWIVSLYLIATAQ
jgi:hypothetical protein